MSLERAPLMKLGMMKKIVEAIISRGSLFFPSAQRSWVQMYQWSLTPLIPGV